MSLRDHIPHRHHEEDASPPAAADAGDAPLPGYDRMSVHDLIADMHNHSQAELAAMEEYESGHENRTAIINKLHYMRSREPWQGYDEMPEEEVIARLENADDPTIKHVRDYEHKFHNRPVIIEAAMHLHHERLASMPPREVPAYQPGGARN